MTLNLGKVINANKLMAVARVIAYFGVVSAVLGAYATHEAKAAFTEEGFVLGRDMAKVAELLDHTYEININGQKAYLASVDTLMPKQDILDRYEEMCRDNNGLLGEAWKSLPNDKRTIRGTNELTGLVASMGVARKDSEHEGMVACLAKSKNNDGTLSPGEALANFSKTGELSYIGRLRYVYVTGPSPSGRWSVTTLWTEENFNVDRIGPPEGTDDAPGSDSPTIGRPPSSQRTFSCSITGAPYALRMYNSQATPENVYAKFDSTMTSDGWMIFALEGAPHTYFKDGIETMVTAGTDPHTHKTLVMISELGGDMLRAPSSPAPYKL